MLLSIRCASFTTQFNDGLRILAFSFSTVATWEKIDQLICWAFTSSDSNTGLDINAGIDRNGEKANATIYVDVQDQIKASSETNEVSNAKSMLIEQ